MIIMATLSAINNLLILPKFLESSSFGGNTATDIFMSGQVLKDVKAMAVVFFKVYIIIIIVMQCYLIFF